MNINTLEERIGHLERRIVALEGKMFHSGGLGAAVRRVVAAWPGPFTSNMIRDAVYETRPELVPVTEQHQVCTIINRMEKQNLILCTQRGAGPTPNIYERVTNPPAGSTKCGAKMGQRHGNESGFRTIIRTALADLPEEFTIQDLRDWVAKHLPDAKIPYGSWTSTLYKMCAQQELRVVRGGRRSGGSGLKVYGRGPRRVAPSGEELRDLEAAWAQFRAENPAPERPGDDYLTPQQRGEI